MATQVWTLPWHYLSALTCLIRHATVSGCDEHSHSFITHLKTLSQNERRRVLDPSQDGRADGDPPLFEFIHDAGKAAGKLGYHWQPWWPAQLGIRIRRMPPGRTEEIVISRKAIILPWPFPGDDGSLDELVASDGLVIPELEIGSGSLDDLDASTDFYGFTYMQVLDDLLAGNKRHILEPNRLQTAKETIEDEVKKGTTLSFPPSLQVNVYDWMLTIQTCLVGYSDHIHVHAGWVESGGTSPCHDGVDMIDNWPCGAFITVE